MALLLQNSSSITPVEMHNVLEARAARGRVVDLSSRVGVDRFASAGTRSLLLQAVGRQMLQTRPAVLVSPPAWRARLPLGRRHARPARCQSLCARPPPP
jgi:hypothetical protein